ncbi:MAG: CoA-binding protein [Clostridium sp.]|uniref:CoA-binding protein n=1 Tax=Clostridium sp. TaxID=1506 RepID=UPI003D6D66B0
MVNPNVAIKALDKIVECEIGNVWVQPGSYNPQVLDKAKNNELNMVFRICICVELGEI